MRKERGRSWLKNMLFLAALATMVLSGGFAMWQQQSMLTRLNAEIEKKQGEKEDAEMNVEYMNRMLQYTQSEEYIEQQARRILGWVREDERLFIDPNEQSAPAPSAAPEVSTAAPEESAALE